MKETKITFPLSVSMEAYKGKCRNWGKVQYQQQTIDIDQLEELVKEGYCFTHTFKGCDSKVFTTKEKTISNFNETYTVFLDIDDSPITAPEFCQSAETKPSLVYTTPSNVDRKTNRYRLVYLFDEPIQSNDLYKYTVNRITGKLQEEIPQFTLLDTTCINCSQQMGGNSNTDVFINKSYKIYSFYDFKINKDDFLTNGFCIPEEYKKKRRKSIPDGNAEIYPEIAITDAEFVADFWQVSTTEDYWGVFHKYSYKYPIYEATPVDKETPFIELNADYIELRRRNYKIQNHRGGWECYPVKIKKGQRRRTLFNIACLRLKMLPGMSFEHLLYCLLYERYEWVENADRQITNQVLHKIAKDACNKYDKIDYKANKAFVKFKTGYKVNPRFCEEQGLTLREMVNHVRGYASQKRLEEHYDFTKSVKENSRLLTEKGITPNSERALYNFLKAKGIGTKDYLKYQS